jgi:SAM-dependent methyltransferase
MILTEKKEKLFADFFNRYKKYGNINIEVIKKIIDTKSNKNLEDKWYKELEKGNIDYSVYNTDEYIGELWLCWLIYSRKYLLSIQKESSLPPYGIVKDFGKVKKIVDLGCGFGYTTLALKQIFPNAEVYGTNIEDTIQFKFAEKLAKENNFNIVGNINEIKGQTDLVFASEYFEHIQEPIKDLHKIIKYLSPRNFLIANAFGVHAIGHFTSYIVNNENIDQKQISRLFNKELKEFRYEKVKTKLWNNRPAYYKRSI